MESIKTYTTQKKQLTPIVVRKQTQKVFMKLTDRLNYF